MVRCLQRCDLDSGSKLHKLSADLVFSRSSCRGFEQKPITCKDTNLLSEAAQAPIPLLRTELGPSIVLLLMAYMVLKGQLLCLLIILRPSSMSSRKLKLDKKHRKGSLTRSGLCMVASAGNDKTDPSAKVEKVISLKRGTPI